MTKLKATTFKKITNPTDEEKYNYTRFKPLTRVLNALSLTFPAGEKFFCTAIRDHKNKVTDSLKREINEFIRQEAQHSMAHRSLNESLGVNLVLTDAKAYSALSDLGNTPHKMLMTTKALETLTALGGWLYISGGKYLFKDNQVSDMWKYHAKEEVQHEFVAVEVYKQCYGRNTAEYYKHFLKTCAKLLHVTKHNYKLLLKAEKENT